MRSISRINRCISLLGGASSLGSCSAVAFSLPLPLVTPLPLPIPPPAPFPFRARVTSSRCFSPSPSASSASASASPTQVEEHERLWNELHNSGLRCLANGTPDRAIVFFKQAIQEAMAAAASAVSHAAAQSAAPRRFLSLSQIGVSLRQQGEYDEARSLLLQSLSALRSMPSVSAGVLAGLQREVGLCCQELKQTDEAQSALEESLTLYQQQMMEEESRLKKVTKPKEKEAVVTSVQKLMLEQAGTHYSLAMLLHQSAVAASEEMEKGENAPPLTPAHRAALYSRFQESERHYLDALRLIKAAHGFPSSTPLSSDQAKSQSALVFAPMLVSLGTMYSEMEQWQKASERWMEALEIYKEHKDPSLLPVLQAYLGALQRLDPSGALDQVIEVSLEEAKSTQSDEKNKKEEK